jgi:hypothetical protein
MRKALLGALPDHDQSYADLRPPQFTYLPPSHAHALNPDNVIVEGMRGAGKSHWWNFLNSPKHLGYLRDTFPEARIATSLDVSQGFGVGVDPAVAPLKDSLVGLLQQGHNPRHIWQAVIAVHAEFPAPYPGRGAKWSERVQWIRDNPEDYDAIQYGAGELLKRKGRKRLILFDALDRLADDWRGVRPLARALFQLALDISASRGLRLKLFVRPDMLEDKEILAFPDSSKLLARKVALTWRRADLYALLFQCLANDKSHGEVFRNHAKKVFHLRWQEKTNETWALPNELRSDESVQKDVFHALAGPAMATGQFGHKRGFPYTWLPNHLVDGRDQVSPRSFFAALRSAAASDPPQNWEYALHYRAIQAGVQEASKIRVKEITQEDYPWVEPLMEPLKTRITVPCTVDDVTGLWLAHNTLGGIQDALARTDVKLLPPHFEEGDVGVLRDLKDLGVINYLSDERIQMPDVYRIAFGLGRKGGVKPLK